MVRGVHGRKKAVNNNPDACSSHVKKETTRSSRKTESKSQPEVNSRLLFNIALAVFTFTGLIYLGLIGFGPRNEPRGTPHLPVLPQDSVSQATSSLNKGWEKASYEDEALYNTTVCNIEKRYADTLTREEFEMDFRYKRPLILKFREIANVWVNNTRWTKQSLLKEFGDHVVLSGTADGIVRSGGNGNTKSTLQEYIEFMNDKEPRSSQQYVFDRSFHNTSTLRKTIKPPAYLEIKEGEDSSFFFLGGSGTGVSFHKHADGWNGVIFGRKRWFLYPPQRTPTGGVWPSFSQQDWFRKVYPYLEKDQLPLECIQEAGEILYLPESFYHGTINIGDTVAIGIQKKQAQTKVEGYFYEASARTTDDHRREELYRELRKILPGNAEVLHKLSRTLYDKKQHSEAIELMKKASALDPWFVISKVDLSEFYAATGNMEMAIREVQQALVVHPDSIDGNWQHLRLLLGTGQLQGTVKAYHKIIKLTPGQPFLYFELANILTNLGETQEAKIVYDQGVQIDQELNN